MAFNINDFRTNGLEFGGARPTLFQVQITPPVTGINTTDVSLKLTLTCQATTIPASTVGSIDIGYFGRKIKLAGDRTFDDWSVTILNDEDFLVRDKFEKWLSDIDQQVQNVKTYAGNNYKSATDTIVTQFDKNGNIIKQYGFVGMFPLNVSPMDLSWDSVNTIQSFGVTFAYDYWYPIFTASNIAITV